MIGTELVNLSEHRMLIAELAKLRAHRAALLDEECGLRSGLSARLVHILVASGLTHDEVCATAKRPMAVKNELALGRVRARLQENSRDLEFTEMQLRECATGRLAGEPISFPAAAA